MSVIYLKLSDLISKTIADMREKLISKLFSVIDIIRNHSPKFILHKNLCMFSKLDNSMLFYLNMHIVNLSQTTKYFHVFYLFRHSEIQKMDDISLFDDVIFKVLYKT